MRVLPLKFNPRLANASSEVLCASFRRLLPLESLRMCAYVTKKIPGPGFILLLDALRTYSWAQKRRAGE